MAFTVYTETCDHPNTSETQQFIAAAVGTLGFTICIYTNASLENRVLVGSLIAFYLFPLNPTYTGTNQTRVRRKDAARTGHTFAPDTILFRR